MYQFILRSDDELEAGMWERFVYCCTQVPSKDNFYLSWFLRGRAGYDPLIRPDFCPLYLQEAAFGKLKVRCIEDYLNYIYNKQFIETYIQLECAFATCDWHAFIYILCMLM